MTSRDPGFIAKAFPSRARNIMAGLRGFHQQVMALDPGSTTGVAMYDPAHVANNPESEAAMRAEANRGRTSRRSPGRPSAATRSQLTGVTERVQDQGWVESPTSLPHLCFPPDTYPQACGPGSQWMCRCGALWVARGIMWPDGGYPQTPTRMDVQVGPERWFYVEGGQLSVADYQAQESLYDWRPLGPYYVKLYRAMLDTLQGKGDTDWRDMG